MLLPQKEKTKEGRRKLEGDGSGNGIGSDISGTGIHLALNSSIIYNL